MYNESEEYWQDNHIVKAYDYYHCYGECGQYLTKTKTRTEARDYLDHYEMYVLNNITD